MQRILLQGREHPLTIQGPIVLLHRSSTNPLHYDATQPTHITRSSSTYISQLKPNPREPSTPTDTQSPLKPSTPPNQTKDQLPMNDEPIGPPDSQTSSQEFPSEQLFQSTDESTTSPLSCFPKRQNPHRYEATLQEDQIKDVCPLPETDTTEHLNPSAELPQQTQIPDPYISSTDEYSDSDSSDSEFEQPLDWDDMDPAQRHAWLRDHPIPTPIPSKLLSTKTENLTKLQLKKLRPYHRMTTRRT